MKKSVRLFVFAVSLAAVCAGLLTQRSTTQAKCVEPHRVKTTPAHASDTPHALPTLPGMRFFTRSAM